MQMQTPAQTKRICAAQREDEEFGSIIEIRSAMSQRHDCLLYVWEMAGPVRRDMEQRPLTVYSRAHSRGILRKVQIQGGYVAAANRLGCLVLHLAIIAPS